MWRERGVNKQIYAAPEGAGVVVKEFATPS